MKLDLLSSATVLDRAVRFVENHQSQSRGLTDRNKEVRVHDPAELIQDSR